MNLWFICQIRNMFIKLYPKCKSTFNEFRSSTFFRWEGVILPLNVTETLNEEPNFITPQSGEVDLMGDEDSSRRQHGQHEPRNLLKHFTLPKPTFSDVVVQIIIHLYVMGINYLFSAHIYAFSWVRIYPCPNIPSENIFTDSRSTVGRGRVRRSNNFNCILCLIELFFYHSNSCTCLQLSTVAQSDTYG